MERDVLERALQAIQVALPWLDECNTTDEMGMPVQNPPLQNSIELLEEVEGELIGILGDN